MAAKKGWMKKKTYGTYKTASCPFCGKIATAKTETGLEVCHQHKNTKMEEIKCTCGSWLEQLAGKFGPYFNCLNCGNINYNKAMEMKGIVPQDRPKPKPVASDKPFRIPTSYSERNPKETTISSRDVDYFD